MTEEMHTAGSGGSNSLVKNIILGVIGVMAVGSLYGNYALNERVHDLEAKQIAAETKLGQKIAETKSHSEQIKESLSEQVGQTQKALSSKTAELSKQQKQSEARLSEEQQKQQAALSEVSGAVSGVKSDVGGVKTDVAATKTDLEATKAKLERAIGDLGLQSGLIAHTREDLDELRRKGERNYYEFTLNKNKAPTAVSTVSLQLKKVDQKKAKFTMNVMADDHTIEKKDKNLMEPVQFYTGKDRMLYELVVFQIGKDVVSGYISTPKNAPVPVSR